MTDTSIPAVVPPLPRARTWARNVTPADAFGWLAAGWRDCWVRPASSFGYGLLVFLVSIGTIWGLLRMGWDYIVFPAFTGFVVIGPFLAIALYEKSRRIAAGEPVSLAAMIFVRPKSGGQILFTGVLLAMLVSAWIRAAVMIYALFFGVRPFPGIDHLLMTLVATPTGWGMLAVGSAVGAVFAFAAFALSAFSIPMLLDQRVDALTAMGTSAALVVHNLPAMLTWGVLVFVLFASSAATGFLGMIVVFPLLGHGTWHAYRAIRA